MATDAVFEQNQYYTTSMQIIYSVISSSKVTLIINAITPILINEPLKVVVDFESHVSDDMTVLHNFVKSSRRLQTVKELLDDQVRNYCSDGFRMLFIFAPKCVHPSLSQWTTHPIYQENYYNLLSANEIGNLITYTPSQISSYLDSFDGYYKAALNEVCLHVLCYMC